MSWELLRLATAFGRSIGVVEAVSTGAAGVRSTRTLKLWKIPLSNRVRQRRGHEEHRASEVESCGGKKQASSRVDGGGGIVKQFQPLVVLFDFRRNGNSIFSV
ncbi:hypothetical protein LXL04_023802 [Taraxacum kok-saghyz]